VEQPGDAIETTSWTVWLEDGMVMARSRGVSSTGESEDEFFSIVREFVDGTPRPLFYDAREWPGGDATAWAVAGSNMDSMLTAGAMLVEPDSSAGKSPFALDRLLIPFRLFTDPAEALTFAQRFRPSE